MKKEGFTLVELLCVIIIIAVVSGIVFPIVLNNINKSKEELLNVQIKDIEAAAKKWALKNLDKLDKYHINDVYVSISYLQDVDLLDKDTLLNPKTKDEMTGCVLIRYDFDTKQYTYKYNEIDCTALSNDDDESSQLKKAFIVYSDVTNVDRTHAKVPFFQTLLDNNEIRVDGETTPGLYDLDSEYVFRGTDNDPDNTIRNYVVYGDHTWRILSISKDDHTMKLISTNTDHNAWSSGEIRYDKLETLPLPLNLDSYTSGNVTYKYLLDQTWYNGLVEVDDPELSLNDAKSALTAETIHHQRGLLSIYDYALASTECMDNILDVSCKNNNYLFDMFAGRNVWTMNNNGTKIWCIGSDGSIKLDIPTNDNNYFYPVIKVPVSVFQAGDDADEISTQTGASTNPYIIMSTYKSEIQDNEESDV